VNLHGTLALLEAARILGPHPRFVFASSIAAYGGVATPKAVFEKTRLVPQTTYGTTKVIGELLINDYSRKGFIDGRAARLGMVIVRPGKPNRAASGFGSSIIREPLNGLDYTVPVPLETRIPVMGYRTAVDGLLALHELDGVRLGDERVVNLPMISVSLDQIVDALKRVASDRKLGSIDVAPDPFTTEIVAGWPSDVGGERAQEFGLPRDETVDEIIRAYIEDYADASLLAK
ncbi:MAG: NAD-dependent epimerase/dehydratase family protein, partial [Rhodospirillaceae bacterium]